MGHSHRFLGLLAVAVAAIGIVAIHQRGAYAGPREPVDKELAALGKALERAFNAHDAQALSALWTEQAVYHSTTTGTEFSGRPAIGDAYAKLFAADPKSTLAIEVRSAKVKADDAAVLIGVAQVDHPGQASTRSLFEATLARVGTNWLIARVEESDVPPDAAAGLSPLGWLAGRWAEELPTGSVVNQFRWVDGGGFLIRNYWVDRKDAPRLQGTQVFGWDAEQECIRTWLFDSGGSFGEGYWLPDGPTRWVNKLAIKLSDGRRAAVTQILERVGDDQLTVQLIDRDIDGAAEPNGPVATLVRTAEPKKKPTPATAPSAKGELR
jgi:uncharacterized protein (TIGR02246 family)